MTDTSGTTPFPVGVYAGDPDAGSASNEAAFEATYSSFTDLIGSAPQFIDYYVDQSEPISSWVSNAGFYAYSAASSPDAASATPVIGLPMVSLADSSITPDQYFKNFADGDYDSVINNLVKTWAAEGFTTQYWRPGWEMNLAGTVNYAGEDAQSQADWVAAFQHIYTVLHAAGDEYGVNVQVIWNPGLDNYSNVEATTDVYPGNDYVDIIGADAYSDIYPYSDSSGMPTYHDWDTADGNTSGELTSVSQFIADPVDRDHYWSDPAATKWNDDSSDGHSLSLDQLIQFAEAQGKPFAIPETGAGNSDAGTDVQDDAAWPQWLAEQLTAAQNAGEKIDFVNIWDSNGGGNYEFSNASDDKPNEAAAWSTYFGATAASTSGTSGLQGVGGDDPACYLRGTAILTHRGELPVEDLVVGDILVTHSGARRPLRWIGRRSYAARFVAGNTSLLPVTFHRGSIADGIPRRDLLVSPLHAMFIDDVLIPARELVNGISIVQHGTEEPVEYFHLELETHDVILAEGAPSETFVDDGSRGIFHNAAEYALLYPDAVPEAPRFCAPRLEYGEDLERIRRRLAERQAGGKDRDDLGCAAPLQGYLDEVGPAAISGWAFDPAAPGSPCRLRVLADGIELGEIVADAFRGDLATSGIGAGCHSFTLPIAGRLRPGRHVISVQRASDGMPLPNSPWLLELPAPAAASVEAVEAGQGWLDRATRQHVEGWAHDGGAPGTRVALLVFVNGEIVARELANRFRGDLAQSGIGDGRHAFDIAIPGGLSPLTRNVIEVRREADGVPVGNSPWVIEAADSFDASLESAVGGAVAAVATKDVRERVLSFIMAQADILRQQAADSDGQRAERQAHRQVRRRWGPQAERASQSAAPAPRALVLDSRLPAAGRDAGSAAIMSHMSALQSLGYAVSFVAANEIDGRAPLLEAAGITCCGAPFYNSVEDVLRRQADCFDLVYLHRAEIAASYLALARRYLPRARILYSVADLHHVRLERQAAIDARPELVAESQRMRMTECMTAWSADVVITHSPIEAELLRQAVPHARIRLVPWHVPARPTAIPFAGRRGVAFIGNYGHPPNEDAAHWLVHAVMPLVWQSLPGLPCLLVGSGMTDRIRRLVRPGVVAVGQAGDLGREVFDRVRLTVAPLRYGAGVKGKVLDSLAAGVPCALSPVAAEGLELPPVLQALVGDTAEALAARICRLHADEAANEAAAAAGLGLIRQRYTAGIVANALRAAIGGKAPAAADEMRIAG